MNGLPKRTAQKTKMDGPRGMKVDGPNQINVDGTGKCIDHSIRNPMVLRSVKWDERRLSECSSTFERPFTFGTVQDG